MKPEYRIKFAGGSFYAQVRTGLFWRKLVERSNWVDDSYACETRDRALELIEADARRRAYEASQLPFEYIQP